MRIGTDIVEVARIEKAITNEKSGFLSRVFTANEIRDIGIMNVRQVFGRRRSLW